MPQSAYIGLLLILVNCIVSYRGFKDSFFFERYVFEVEKLTIYKDYKRLITSGFLHSGWLHLILNMFSLYFFSRSLESTLGGFLFLLVYFISLAGGNLLALYVNRLNSGYRVVGASGAVCGVIFASIALTPGMSIGLFPIPISLPAWIYGLAFVAYSIYGISSKKDNTGHEAHLGGALIGLLVAILIRPSAFVENYIVISIIAIPCIVFLYLIITRPHMLLLGGPFAKRKKPSLTVDQKFNIEKNNRQKEVDAILEKIHQKGMASLSKSEKEKLEAYSRTVR
jgi:membrane associated rhomboid family serine protease